MTSFEYSILTLLDAGDAGRSGALRMPDTYLPRVVTGMVQHWAARLDHDCLT